jgi:putative transposase
VVDGLLAGAQGEQEIVSPGGLLSQLTKRLVERAMEVELTDHLGYEAASGAARWRGERKERHDPQDALDRAGGGADRRAKGPCGDVRAADRQKASAAL